MQSLLNVLRKEWRDSIRDRRSLLSALSYAVMTPLIMYLVLGNVAKKVDQTDDLRVAVVGSEQAPTLITKLAEQGVEWIPFDTTDAAAQVSDLKVLVTVPDDYEERYLARTPIDIAVTANFKNSQTEAEAKRIARLINGYGRKVSYSRLVAAGVSPDSVRAISAKTYDLSQAGGRASHMSNMFIYMFLLGCFISGALMATDSIAGERERHSLESLLAQPVKPVTLVLGKWLTAGGISAFVAVSTIVLTGVMLAFAPLDVLGLRLYIDPASIVQGALILIPLALLAVSLQMLLAARARTYREAGIYAQFAIAIPVVVAGSVMIGNVDYGAIGQVLPVTSQTMALKDVLLEGRSSMSSLLGGAISTVLLALALVWLTSQRLSDERSL